MRVKIKFASSPGSVWYETYDVDVPDAEAYVKGIVAEFNNTLRPGESSRRVLSFAVLNDYSIEKHSWQKQNLVTLSGRAGLYDVMKCSACGITAKRYGMSNIVIDKKYQGFDYARCDYAQIEMGGKLPIRGRR